MTVSELVNKKKEYGYSNEYIYQKTGVPVSTIQKIFSGTTSTPRRKTLEALSKLFEESSQKYILPDSYGFFSKESASNISFVSEEASEYQTTEGSGALDLKAGHDKTLADYLALPDDIRVEMIDGVFYDMASPSSIHQQMSIHLSSLLFNHIMANNGSCVPFSAPMDVQLDCDDKTIVEPDVFVVCDRNKIKKQRIVGAPDFIIEILSPNYWFHDTIRKLKKYKKAGVREYWIVAPDAQKIIVYFFEKSPDPEEYSFADEIPVNIWNGKLKINFKEIFDRIRFMY